jgi:hypothetical protein
VNVNHSLITKIYEKGMNSPSRGIVERQQAQKKAYAPRSSIFFFITKYPLKKDDVH